MASRNPVLVVNRRHPQRTNRPRRPPPPPPVEAAKLTCLAAPAPRPLRHARRKKETTSPALTRKPTPSTNRSKAANSSSRISSRWTPISFTRSPSRKTSPILSALRSKTSSSRSSAHAQPEWPLMYGEGVLEILPDGFKLFARRRYNYLPCPDDICIAEPDSAAGLRNGASFRARFARRESSATSRRARQAINGRSGHHRRLEFRRSPRRYVRIAASSWRRMPKN